MGAHGSKEKLYRANSEKFPSKLPVPNDKKYKLAVNRERFGSFGARGESSMTQFFLIYFIVFLKIPVSLAYFTETFSKIMLIQIC